MKETLNLEIRSGVPIITYKNEVILVDTGSPITIHSTGNLHLFDQNYQVASNYGSVNIQSISRDLGFPITAILGMDIMRNFQLIFNYPIRQISFMQNESLDDVHGEEIPVAIHHGLPVLSIVLPSGEIPVFLDTGANLSYLRSELTRTDYKNMGQREDFHPFVGRFSTTVYSIYTDMGSHSFYVDFGNLPPRLDHFLGLINGNNGILGYDFFKQFKLCLDVPNGRLILINRF